MAAQVLKGANDTFMLGENQQGVISAINLLDGEQFAVEYMACEDCENQHWIEYSPCGMPILIDQYYNPVKVSTPGRYRISPVGKLHSGAAACVSIFGE